MSVSYNFEALKKLSNEELEKIFTEKTNPSLKSVLSKIKRKATKKAKKEEK